MFHLSNQMSLWDSEAYCDVNVWNTNSSRVATKFDKALFCVLEHDKLFPKYTKSR